MIFEDQENISPQLNHLEKNKVCDEKIVRIEKGGLKVDDVSSSGDEEKNDEITKDVDKEIRFISELSSHSLEHRDASTAEPLHTQNMLRVHDLVAMFDPENLDDMGDQKCVFCRDGTIEVSEDELKFNSQFECGNLKKVYKLGDDVYGLFLDVDCNTNRHTQWFYFSVQGMKAQQDYQFIVLNCTRKKRSLFNEGMKPLVYSEDDQQGWRRCGFDMCYYQTKTLRNSKDYYYSLTFKFTPLNNGVHYFTQSYPYSYSELLKDLETYENIANENQVSFERKVLCQTMSGKDCPLITITDAESKNQKSAVVLSSRVHPGETQASFMMKGALEFLISNDEEAKTLRSQYVFEIVPMLNPDGVIRGNYRCNLNGEDLNRTWKDPSPETNPTIYHLKNLIQSTHQNRNVELYLDMHGHSRKKNIFIYGCNSKFRSKKLAIRCYPLILSEHSQLSFDDCEFNLYKSKSGSARCAVFQDIGIQNSYTIEASLCGPKDKREHYQCKDYELMGKDICKGLIHYRQPSQYDEAMKTLDMILPLKPKKKTQTLKQKRLRLQKRFSAGQNTDFFKNRSQGVEIVVSKQTSPSDPATSPEENEERTLAQIFLSFWTSIWVVCSLVICSYLIAKLF